jgi:hypothetical protein
MARNRVTVREVREMAMAFAALSLILLHFTRIVDRNWGPRRTVCTYLNTRFPYAHAYRPTNGGWCE